MSLNRIWGNRIWCEPYVVRKNDSLTRVFQEKGGIIDENPEEFLKIFKRLNPQVKDLESIRPGQQIYIPLKKMDPEAERSGNFSEVPQRKEIAADFRTDVSRIFTLPMVTVSQKSRQLPNRNRRPMVPVFTEYKIKPGDTLSRIFHQLLRLHECGVVG